MTKSPPVTGSCNCGGVKFTVSGPLRQGVACHCQQCRKQSGLYFAATDVSDADLHFEADGSLKWYEASDMAKRGFCGTCGSSLFWKANGSDCTSILIGCLDGDAGGVKIERHIFVDYKGAYYEIHDELEQFPHSDLESPRPPRG